MQYLNEGNARAMGITAVKFCRKCGAAIPPDSPQHSCGACLLETGLGLLADEPVAGRLSDRLLRRRSTRIGERDSAPRRC